MPFDVKYDQRKSVVSRILILLIILFFSKQNSLCAQEKEAKFDHSKLTLNIGVSSYAFRDKVFSPLKYQGISIPFFLQYQSKENQKIRHQWGLSFDNGEFQSTITRKFLWSTNFVNTTFINFNYLASREIKPFFMKNWLTSSQLGLGWNTTLFVKEYQITASQQTASIDFISSLQFYHQFEKKLQKEQSLSFQLKYSIIGYVWGRIRQPLDVPNQIKVDELYNENDTSGLGDIKIIDALRAGDVLVFPQLLEWESQVDYTLPLTQKTALIFSYRYRSQRYRKFALNSFGNSNFLIGIIFSL